MAGRTASAIVYPGNCLLSPAFMARHGIVFKKIPREVSRF
jgi:adenine-specific DNA-methyltransferase